MGCFNTRMPVNSLHKGQWHWALMFSLICARINSWVHNREACDLRRHQAHYYVTEMYRNFHNKDVLSLSWKCYLYIETGPRFQDNRMTACVSLPRQTATGSVVLTTYWPLGKVIAILICNFHQTFIYIFQYIARALLLKMRWNNVIEDLVNDTSLD